MKFILVQSIKCDGSAYLVVVTIVPTKNFVAMMEVVLSEIVVAVVALVISDIVMRSLTDAVVWMNNLQLTQRRIE